MKSIVNYIKSKDLYGRPYSLLHNGESTHNTFIGGVMSISIRVLMLAYATSLILKVKDRDKVISVSKQVVSFFTDERVLDLTTDFFDISIGFSYDNDGVYVTDFDEYFRLEHI